MNRIFALFLAIAVVACCSWYFSNGSVRDSKSSLPTKVPSSHFFEQRAYPFGKVDTAAMARARHIKKQQQLANHALPSAGQVWLQRGPNNIQGRVTSIAVDQTNDNIAYIGAAEGGVFKTTDAGNSWTAMFDDQPSISIGAVAIDPSNPNVVYAGTGEVNPGGGSVAYGGTGLYRSMDGGVSWNNIGLAESGAIGRIVIHPNNPDLIHVAVMGHLWTGGPDRGVYRTTDAGATWSRVLFVNETTGCVDLIQRPDDPNVLFAAMWQRIRGPEAYDYGGTGCAVYRSVDGGLTWSVENNGLPGISTNRGRIGLAICQSDPDVMCAIYADRTGFFDGLYRTTNGGTNWLQTNDGSLSGAFASFGWWFGNVRIHPQNPNTIFVIGFDVYRSTNGGGSYAVVGSNMHVDHHGFAFGAGSNPMMYAGNDGGVYTSSNGSTFTKTSGDLPITQAYRIATAPWNSAALWIGSQDNGTAQDLNADGDFNPVFGGDGFQPIPHLTDSNRLWVQFQYGNVFYSSNSGGSFNSATNGLSGRFNWNAPHAQDPGDPSTRYFGTHRVYRNNGNTSWVAISGDLTGGPHQGNNGQVNGTLTSISVSPVDSNVIWSGSDDGLVHVTQNGGASWTDVSAGLPERWITSLFCHPEIAGEALVSVSGFRWGEDIAHIYRTTNFGQTWQPLDGDLPDMPVNDVFVDPEFHNQIYAATDVGVFRSTNLGVNWHVYGIGLPNVVVTDLAFQNEDRQLFAGTYGRSIFSIELGDLLLGDINCDGVVDLLDVQPFIDAIGNSELDPKADLNLDGVDNLLDVAPFVSVLSGD